MGSQNNLLGVSIRFLSGIVHKTFENPFVIQMLDLSDFECNVLPYQAPKSGI